MKILYLVHDCKRGGAQISFLDMISCLKKRGDIDIYVITPHMYGFVPEELTKMGIEHICIPFFWWEIGNKKVYALNLCRRGLYWVLSWWNEIAAVIIAKYALRKGIDIIHTNSSVIDVGAKASDKSGIKHVWHLREIGRDDFGLYSVRKDKSLKSVLGQGDSTFIAISEYVKNYYEQIVSRDVIKIFNGISQKYSLKKYGENYSTRENEPIQFLITGNYSEAKGQMIVVDAVRRLVDKQVTNFVVKMAGSGDFSPLLSKASAYGILEHILVLGEINDMTSLRASCDVEIVASRNEAFGRVTIEAMRSSNPVVGSNSGGTAELIRNGETGILFEPENADDLADKMERFIKNPHLISEMGKKAYEYSVSKFSSDENEKNIIDLYHKILKPQRALFVLQTGNVMYGASRSIVTLLNALEIEYDIMLSTSFTQKATEEEIRKDFKHVRKIFWCWVPRYRCYPFQRKGAISELSHLVNNTLALLTRGHRRRIITSNYYDYVHLNSLCLYPMIDKCNRYIIHDRDFINDKYWMLKYFVKKTSQASGVIYIDETTRGMFEKYIRLDERILLNNPFDMRGVGQYDKVKCRERYGIENDKTVIAMLGQIDCTKGSDFVIEAVASLERSDICLLIVGNNQTTIARRIMKKYENDERIKFVGEIKDTFPIYRVSDYIIRGDEFFCVGRTIYEGLFSGCRVIMPGNITDIASLDEHEKYTDSIITYLPRNQEALQRVLYAANPVEETGRRYLENCFEYANKYMYFVNGICQRP